MELKSCLWPSIPPTSIPYFSTSRKPGVVFRVPARIPVYPACFTNSSIFLDFVATPEHLAMVFSATLSPSRTFLVGPLTRNFGFASILGRNQKDALWVVPCHTAIELTKDLVDEGNSREDARAFTEKKGATRLRPDHEAAVIEGWCIFFKPMGDVGGEVGRQQVGKVAMLGG